MPAAATGRDTVAGDGGPHPAVGRRRRRLGVAWRFRPGLVGGRPGPRRRRAVGAGARLGARARRAPARCRRALGRRVRHHAHHRRRRDAYHCLQVNRAPCSLTVIVNILRVTVT